MSENHVAEQLPDPDSDSGHEIGHTHSNGVDESTTEEDATAAMNQVPTNYQLQWILGQCQVLIFD